ncbi:hypothetical protein IW261DRAFT_1420893 [Armillaria novae-zelandiae]|uniref:Uncharacterized protein n=1 Tax=Armillaria novae-zelandiae TaxID=153914 RepID=A0AA39UG82_9AGAR|nr:hypothetical protein IW261DRAFT_1420893 [Armillaria novae-zelandiae]
MSIAHPESTGNVLRTSVYDTFLQLGLLERNSMISDWMFEDDAGLATRNAEPREEELSTDTESVYSSPSMRGDIPTSLPSSIGSNDKSIRHGGNAPGHEENVAASSWSPTKGKLAIGDQREPRATQRQRWDFTAHFHSLVLVEKPAAPRNPKRLRRPKSLRPDPKLPQSNPFRSPRFSPTIEVPDGDNSDGDTSCLPLSASSAEDPPTPDALLREYAAGRRPLSFSTQIQRGSHHSDEDPFSATPSASSRVPVTRPVSFNGSYLTVPGTGARATVQRSVSAIHQRGRQVPFPTKPISPIPLSLTSTGGDQKLRGLGDLYRQDLDVAIGENVVLGEENIGRRKYERRQQDTKC